MNMACKQGGLIVVQGLVDEAIHEGWAGFHQYNFTMNLSGEVCYSGRDLVSIKLQGDQIFKVMKHLPHASRDWFISVWKK